MVADSTPASNAGSHRGGAIIGGDGGQPMLFLKQPLACPRPAGYTRMKLSTARRAAQSHTQENEPAARGQRDHGDNPKTRVESRAASQENCNPGPGNRPLYPDRGSMDRAPQGAPALCCSVAPLVAGVLGGAVPGSALLLFSAPAS